MRSFHFFTQWSFTAPVDKIWQAIIAVPTWPEWWGNWKKAELNHLLNANQDYIMAQGFSGLRARSNIF